MTNRLPIYPQTSVNVPQKPPWLCAVFRFARPVSTFLRDSPPPCYTAVNPCGSRMEGTLGGYLCATLSHLFSVIFSGFPEKMSTEKTSKVAKYPISEFHDTETARDARALPEPCPKPLPLGTPSGTPSKGLFALHSTSPSMELQSQPALLQGNSGSHIRD